LQPDGWCASAKISEDRMDLSTTWFGFNSGIAGDSNFDGPPQNTWREKEAPGS